MKASADKKTGDLLPDFDLAGERPAKLTQREKTAARVERMRAGKNLLPFTVNIDADLKRDFDAYLDRTGKTRNAVIEQVLRTQVLRKR